MATRTVKSLPFTLTKQQEVRARLTMFFTDGRNEADLEVCRSAVLEADLQAKGTKNLSGIDPYKALAYAARAMHRGEISREEWSAFASRLFPSSPHGH